LAATCKEALLSYDIELYRLSGAGDLLAQVRERRQRQEEPTPSAEKDQDRAKLAADLVALHPSLYSAPYDKGPSFGCVVDATDLECPVPLIYIDIDDAMVTFPYSANFERILPELKRVIEVFERHGYTAYDRQIDAILTSSSSLLESASSFATTGAEAVQQMLARGETVIGGGGELIGAPTEKKPSWTVLGFVIFLVAAIGLVVARQQYMSELPPNPTKELRDLQERLKNRGSLYPESLPNPERR
jgi:shikimate kinase